MFKYMKYEIKGTYKFILGLLALVLILFTGIYAYISKADRVFTLGSLFIGLSIMIIFGAALVVFLYIVGSFRKELYEDSGYLTFTLPLTGNQIVGSKLIVALLWFLILGMVIAIYNFIMVMIFIPVEMNIVKLFSMIQGVSIKEIIFVVLTPVFSGVSILILIYFSMSLSKVTFRNKKIGGLWFILFLLLGGVLAYGDYEICKLLPYYLDLNSFHLTTMETLNGQYHLVNNNDGFYMSVSGAFAINIASCVYNVGTIVALFLGTSYLIERKINL
ncbi:hypothetical protein [Ectobacillus polymachus]|uniref:hypothetical protein n=1 Tax=Ectobacillus polymachus TaxID=1508806 RepID=UPI003A8B7ACE